MTGSSFTSSSLTGSSFTSSSLTGSSFASSSLSSGPSFTGSCVLFNSSSSKFILPYIIP
ncbi:hypothetical protein IJG90_03730 [Candidatus Saccharibacteria bacterium]|nr:hypothetical protein [Candidatus Saccharibacteria bacterium]